MFIRNRMRHEGMRSMRWIWMVVAWSTLSGLAACKARKNASDVKIDNGIFVLDSGSYMPGVLPLTDVDKQVTCTSTAVSDSTLITAAHCVTSAPYEGTTALKDHPDIRKAPAVCVTFPDEGRVCTENVFFPSSFVAPEEGDMAYDVAVAVFPPKTFAYYHAVRFDEAMPVGKKVMMVGYSPLALYSSEFPKRWGRNSVGELKTDDVTTTPADVVAYHTVPDRETVAVSAGDSGGPLLNESCELIAVASRASTEFFEGDKRMKISFHVKFSTPRNTTFFEEAAKTVGATFCRAGTVCDKSRGFVKAVQVSDGKKFPCKAAAEDQDSKIAAAINKLAAIRRQEMARYGDLISCTDFDGVEKRGMTGGICFRYTLVERSDQNEACDAAYISTTGEKILTQDDVQGLYSQKNVGHPLHVYLPDRAKQQLENALAKDGDAALKELKCASKSSISRGCCLRPSCKKIQKFSDPFAEPLGESVNCPSGSQDALVVKTWLSKYRPEGVYIVPSTPQLERGPFPCYDRVSMALRKTTGVCYELMETGGKFNGRCWKVARGAKTSEDVACPVGLLEEETRIRERK